MTQKLTKKSLSPEKTSINVRNILCLRKINCSQKKEQGEKIKTPVATPASKEDL